MTLESYQPGSYTNALYTGDFPTLTNDEEVSRMVELYRRDAGSRLPPGEPPPPSALSSTPTPAEPVADPEIYPTPIPESTTDYGGGGDTPKTDFAGGGWKSNIKPEKPPPEPYPEGDWKATAPPPPNGGRWVGEEISHTPAESKPETPSILGEGVRGVQRAGVGMLHGVEGIANTVEQKLADWTGSEWLKTTAKSDKEALAKRMEEAAKDYAPTVENVTKAFEDPSNAPRYVVGKLGELIPMLAGYAVGGVPAMVIYGALEGANKAYEESGGDIPAALAGAAIGAASWGAQVPFLKGAAGKSLLNNVTRATVGMPVVSTVSEALKPIPKAVAARDIGAYELPTKAEFAEAVAGGVIGGPVIGAHGYANQRAQVRAQNKGVPGTEQYGPNQPPEQYGPELPPRPYPPREPPPGEQYGPELPPRPYPPRELPEQYGPDLPPRPYPPREGEPTKGSPETAPPTVSGDPAATAAIDAAVNPPVVEPAPVREAAPVSEPPPAVRAAGIPVEEAAPPAPRETTTVVKPTETVPPPKPTPEVVTAKPDTSGYMETKPLTTEPDHVAPERQVAKDEAGKVVGKGATPEEALSDAARRGEKPYEETAAPKPAPKTEEFSEEVKAKASRSWGDLARDDATNNTYDAPVNSNRARDAYRAAWEEAASEDAWAARRAQDAERGTQTATGEKPAAAAPGLRRKAQPAAAEEAIAKSKAQIEEPTAAEQIIEARRTEAKDRMQRVQQRAAERIEQRAAEKAKSEQTEPTTVVRRPTKRVEVMVGKRGEGAVAEETPAQTEAADAAHAQQQRRLAEQRVEKLPARAQEARRTSLMASEAGRDIRDVQEAPATSKVTRGTPIEEVGEGMQIEHVGESIAETRSKTTTDKNLRYNDLLHDVLQGNKTLDEASEAAGTKEAGTRGRPRRNKDLADYLDNEVIPRAEKHEAADQAIVERARKVLENPKLSQAKKEEHLEKLHTQMETQVKARGRQEDERANLAKIKEHRDQLRGKEKGADTEANAPREWADPAVTKSNRLAKRLLDLSTNKKIQERIQRSEKDGTFDSSHDYLNDIINDPAAKIAAPDMVEYARHLLRLVPDHVEVGSHKTVGESVGSERIANKTSGGTYYAVHDTVGLHPKKEFHIGHVEKVLHEMTHAVTYKYLDHLYEKVKNGESLNASEQKHVDTLDAIHKETTRLRDEHAISDEEYGMLDYAVQGGSERVAGGRHELVTQIMNNPHVKAVMARTEVSAEFKAEMKRLGYKEPQNLWQAFKAFVKDIVGFKKDSVLDRVLDPMTDILETSAKYREAVDMGLELNAPGRRWKKGDVPTDGLPSQWVRDKMRPFGEAFADSPLFSVKGAKERLEGWKPSLARRGTKAIEVVSPTHKITEANADVLPAGPKVLRARALIDRAAGAYKEHWGNRVQNWVRELRAGPEVAKLMNDATLAKAYISGEPGLFAQRNAHLSPDELKVAETLRDRFDNLTPKQQKLYSDVRDYYRQTYHEQRKLEYEDVVRRFLPEATTKQKEALANQLNTRRGINEVLNNPQSVSPEAAAMHEAFGERWENSRALVKEIAKLQDTGWREGDFFPLRRYGDYVLRYGEQGTKDYGVEMFERSSEAAARREELQKELPEGTHITDVMSKRQDFSRKEFMPESALEDMARSMKGRGATEHEIEQAKDAYAYAMMRRQVSSAQAQSRMYRTGVEGASKDAAQNLINHFNSTASIFGRLTHGAAETEAMRDARQQAKAIENASGTPGTQADIIRSRSQLDALETRFANKDPAVSQEDINHARQQHQWLEKPPSSQQTIRARETVNELEKRRAPVDGDESTSLVGKAAGGFNAASMAYHLIRPAHLALNVADTHANAQSLLGADYGHGRAAAAIVRAMKDLGPSGLSRGFKNAVKAVSGNMQASDWHVGDMLTQKLINLKPGDAAHAQEMRDLSEMTKDYSLVDHTRSREVQRLSRKGGFDFGNPAGSNIASNIASNMMNLFAVGEHTIDSTMRMSVVKAAYDLARARGADPTAAREEARVHAMDVMPVYGGWNTPRIASPRAPYLKDIVPATMQYKLYGFHMYAVMGGLVRKAITRPEERVEAVKALAGLVATHSILAGVTANLFALPVVAALGAWDMFSGKEKPHDYEMDLKRAIADWTGSETVSKFASAGLFGLAGAQQSRSLKLTNMVDVPEIRSFDKAGAGQFVLQGMTGASGDVATQLFEGAHELFSGNWGRAAKMLAPRVFSDPYKAYELGQEGVVDKRGRTITPASQVTFGQQAFQATGFNPYEPALARQKRHAIEEFKGEFEYARQKAVDRYVLSGGKDMSGVRAYMNNQENRRNSPITYQQLRERLKEERKREARPEFYGAMPSKKQERSFREATRFN